MLLYDLFSATSGISDLLSHRLSAARHPAAYVHDTFAHSGDFLLIVLNPRGKILQHGAQAVVNRFAEGGHALVYTGLEGIPAAF